MTKNTHISGVLNNDSIPLSNIYSIKSILNIDKQVEVVPTEVVSQGYSPDEPMSPQYTSGSPQPVDTPPYISSSSTPPVPPQEEEYVAEEESRKQAEDDSEMESVSATEVKESIIPGINQDIFTFNMSELMEEGGKNKKRFDAFIQKLYSVEGSEKLEVSVSDFDSIIEMIKSPDSAINKTPIKGSKLDINFTKKSHDTDSNKSIYKGIRVDYSKKSIAMFTKTITLKKK